MMKTILHFKHFVLLICLTVTASASFAQQLSDEDQRVRDRINSAVMAVYDNALDKDPKDYNTRFARANQLYFNGEYDKAIADAEMVFQQAPEKEIELRTESKLLIARALDIQGKYNEEIEVLKKVSEINPKSLACVDMMAKVSYHVGDLNAAEQNLMNILRNSPMNYDALYWLAKVEVKRNNYEKAASYADRAVSLFTAEPQVYINRSDVLYSMQQYEPAAQDLISALSVGSDSNNALSALINMSDTQYDAVMNALANSYDKAPRVGMFYYVRATIAIRHFHYGQALKDLKSIINNNLYDYHTIYAYAAECQMHLTQWDDALTNINKAIAMEPAVTDYYLLKSTVLLHRGHGKNYDNALQAVEQALALQPTDPNALIAKARLLVAQKKDSEALKCVSKVIDHYPNNSEALMLRGWINKYRMNYVDGANADFEKVLASNRNDLYSLRGFALYELGRNYEAAEWAKKAINDGILPGGETYFYAAALLSNIGQQNEPDKQGAIDYLRSALANGYGSLYEVKVNENPYVNLKLMRKYPQFNSIIEQNQDNFQERR